MKIMITPSFDAEKNRCWLNRHYFNELIKLACLPFITQIVTDKQLLSAYLDDCAGIVISGGVDVNPRAYGEEVAQYCGPYNDDLDQMGLHMIALALAKNMPILGICRGMQLLNVYFGGSLYQDLQKQNQQLLNHDPDKKREEYAHEVEVVDDSSLYSIVQARKIEVNSLHHQGIKDLAKPLRATAYAADGLIEAIEYNENVFGVQWHPEAIAAGDCKQAKILQYFVQRVGQYRTRSR